MIRITTLVVATITLLAACSSFDQSDLSDLTIESNASGLKMTTWPSEQDPGPPFYTRINPTPPHVPNDGEYAAIVFYRGPDGIRSDFNLLEFFDPGPAFGVPLNVSGTSLWHGEVGNGAPKTVNSHGNGAVPVWFVPAEPLLAFIAAQGAEPVLTLPDLADIEGRLEGLATHLQEVLHPHALPPFLGGGGHPNPKINLTARGTLEDGRSFHLSIRAQETPAGDQRTTEIRFR